MTWQSKQGGAGQTVWSGVDEIRDMWHQVAEDRWAFGRIGAWAACVVFLLGGLAACSPIADFFARATTWGGGTTTYWVSSPPPGGCRSVFSACAAEPLLWLVVGVVCLLVALVAGGLALLVKKPSPWITRRWSLTASANDIIYQAGPFSPDFSAMQVSRDGRRWSVPLDAVTRVEAGRTSDWQRVRRYEGKPLHSRDGFAEIPAAESQTFLFMADGSRRVIYTLNDREAAGMLAKSIGAWIEARRNETKSKTNSPAALIAAGEDGFDL